jgi:hypothetical protein
VDGVVVDATTNVVPGVTVDLRDPATNQHWIVVTDDRGAFRVSELSPGTYEVAVTLDGFAPYVQCGLVLTIGATVHVMIPLTPASFAETVTVMAHPPALDSSRTSVTTVIDPERIEELPVRSRNFLEFVLLAPGVAPSQPGGRPAASSALPDSGFSFAGLRPRSNMLTIDGLDNNDEWSGASRTELSLEIVREFQVVNNGWSVENGGASGGAINVVTKSGTNTLHGDVFLFGQSGRLNALPKLEDLFGVRPSLRRYRGGLAVGGPAVKDRTFYYAAAEQEYTRGQAASGTGLRTPSTINEFLAAGGLPRLGTQRLTTGAFPTSFNESELSAKVTHQVNQHQSLMARIAGTSTEETSDAFNSGALTDLSAHGTSLTRDIAFTGWWTTILGPRMTNEARGQLATRRVDRHTEDPHGPWVLIPGVIDFGRPYVGNDRHDQMYDELGDTLAVTGKRHLLKAGINITRIAVTGDGGARGATGASGATGADRMDGAGGTYVFSTLDAFLNRQPNSFRQTFGNPALDLTAVRAGVFAQDRWTPHSTVTMDLGVRFDAIGLPTVLGITDRQFSPRVGVAWVPGPSWVVRGGAGMFADRIALASLERPLLLDGHRGWEQIVDGSIAASIFNANQGGAPSAPLTNIRSSIYTVRSGRCDSSSRQASIGVERGITSDLTASLNYLFVRGHDIQRTVNINLRPPTVQFGRAVFGPLRLDPTRNDIFELQPTASSTYQGVTAAVNRRLSHEIEWSAAYTWSHTTDTASDSDEQPQNPYALGGELADSRYDQRHRFVASALFDLPIGDEEDLKPGEVPAWWVRALTNIELAPIFTIGSRRQLNPIVGTDVSGTHAWPFTDRPVAYGRNSLLLPPSATLDLRLLKFFRIKPHGKLDLVVEAFNVLNRTNVTQLNGVYGLGTSPVASFGRPILAASARHIQFSVDFEF